MKMWVGKLRPFLCDLPPKPLPPAEGNHWQVRGFGAETVTKDQVLETQRHRLHFVLRRAARAAQRSLFCELQGRALQAKASTSFNAEPKATAFRVFQIENCKIQFEESGSPAPCGPRCE
jgi:hypothetical protein